MGAIGWVSATIAALTLLGLIGAALRWLYTRILRPLTTLIEDWRGEAPRPGVPARSGVMERLMSIEERLAVVPALEARLTKVERRLSSIETQIAVADRDRPRMEAGGMAQVERAEVGRSEDARFGLGR